MNPFTFQRKTTIHYLLDLSKITYGTAFIASVLNKQFIYAIISFGLVIVFLAAAFRLERKSSHD